MPPKKGKKKKSGKKSKKSSQSSAKTAEGSTTESEPRLSNEGKANFLVQTKDLERQIEKFQRECDDLEIVNSMFESEFEQTGEDKQDIVAYLEKTIEMRIKEIIVIKEEYSMLEEQRKSDNAKYEEQIKEKTEYFENIKEELESEKRMKTGQLQSMEQFKVQKEELMQKFDDINEKIEQLDKDNFEDVYQRERAAVVEMEELKKTMLTRVNVVAGEFRKVSNRQMSETNKKTIQDNVNLSRKIHNKSLETLRLLEENERLHSIIDREQKIDIQISQAMEKDLHRKYENNLKAIRAWIEQCRSLENDLSHFESDEFRENAQLIHTQNHLITMQTEAQSEEKAAFIEENKHLVVQQTSLQQKLTNSKTNLRTYKRLIHRTKSALIDAENLMDPTEEFTEGEILLRRQKMMDSLLLLLNSSASLGFGINPIEFTKTPSIHT